MNAEEKKVFIRERFCLKIKCGECPLGVVFALTNTIGFRERALVCNLWIHSDKFESLPKGAQRILVSTLGEELGRIDTNIEVERVDKLPDMWGQL